MKQVDQKKHEEYLVFLQKRLASNNYKTNVSKEEYEKTKEKYDKAKLVYKIMTGKQWNV